MELPTIHLKTRSITFDDRMQQVRILHRAGPKDKGQWPMGMIEFLDYKDDKALYYLKKYLGKNWTKHFRL